MSSADILIGIVIGSGLMIILLGIGIIFADSGNQYLIDVQSDAYVEQMGWGDGLNGDVYSNPFNETTNHHNWELYKKAYEEGYKEFEKIGESK